MDWFGRLLSRGRDHVPLQISAIDTPAENDEATTPLFLLVRDASGLASLQLHSFRDADSAREYIEFWFPQRRECSIIAFWAFTSEPETAKSDRLEPTVLVRDMARPGVVYPFSFLSLNEAYAFVHRELEGGVEPEAMLVYWTVPVRISVDAEDRIILTPSVPPALRPAETPTPQPGSGFRARTDPVPSFGPPIRPMGAQPDQRKNALAREVEKIIERAEAIEAASDPDRITGNEDDTEALSEELLRYLRQKRWEQRDEPFQGFNSPPGRF